MNKGKAVSVEKNNPIFDRLEQLSKLQRIGIWVGILILIVAGFVYFSYLKKFERIDRLRTDLVKVEKDLATAKKNARQLNSYRKKMQEAENQFKIVMRALPENEEIPTLLTGISRAGKESGLEFLLFKPRPAMKKDFYAEIPVNMQVTGDYHGVATFFERVAELNRIVNIRDINMQPDGKEGGAVLTTSCTAVTYKFIEETEPKKGNKRRKKRR